ncbi:MAG: hypothetical protein H6551_06915 [Chitinophagales bacterium]|nr:hypothetical protein [Chitinophagaceae bacterium]MCB9064862.1 hypothetical protein [Chitinophagales bacterium]
MKKLIQLTVMVIAMSVSVFAQSRSDVFDSDKDVTWLGMDFTTLNFVGDATQFKDAGEITNNQLREKFFVVWNEIFLDEKDKYDVAGAINRGRVKYATDVTASANSKDKKDHFTNDGGAFRHLRESDIDKMVSGYNYKSNKGVGMMFVVEGMHKEVKKASIWVVFVDMGKKKVLFKKRMDGKAGGFGFKNYWAKSFYNALKEVDDNFSSWSN